MKIIHLALIAAVACLLSACDDGFGPLLVTCYGDKGEIVFRQRRYSVEFSGRRTFGGRFLSHHCVVDDVPEGR